MEVFKGFKGYYWKHRWLLAVSVLCMLCSTALGLVYPKLLQYLIDHVIKTGHYEVVPKLSLLVVGVIFIKGLFSFSSGWAGGRFGNWVGCNLRDALYSKWQYLSFQFYDKARTGDMMSRATADLQAVRQFTGFGFTQLMNVGAMLLFGSLMMLSINWKLTIITIVMMPFLAMTAIKFQRRIHPSFRSIRWSLSQLTTAAQENITGVRTVKSFAREPHEVDKFATRNEDYRATNVGSARIWSKYFPVMEFFANVSVVLLISTGGWFVISNQMTIGQLGAFLTMIWYIINPMFGIGFQINNYTQSVAAGERILEMLNEHIHVKDDPNAIALDGNSIQGAVHFDHVTFSYDSNQPALYDFDLNVKPGSVIGLLGGTGSGKSTVIQLMLRAYNVKAGHIYIDGHDVNDLTVESLRKQMAIVFQDTFLFSASIMNNIAYGRPNTSMEEVVRAAKLAEAHEFIMELPEGYNTIVGERGMGLSGGQKQRIAIARAILKDPRILILDDATSAVDMETEHQIQAGFKEVMQGRTTFIIAHRISSLKHADEIIVLDNGRIIQRGTHDELLREEGHYLDTYRIQYSDMPENAEEGMDGKDSKRGRLAN